LKSERVGCRRCCTNPYEVVSGEKTPAPPCGESHKGKGVVDNLGVNLHHLGKGGGEKINEPWPAQSNERKEKRRQ